MVKIIRTRTGDSGTFGVISANGLNAFTGELPWKDNQPRISCIPAGTYDVSWAQSPSKGWCYHVMNVPNRSEILIHSGNYCGDRNQGFLSDFLGCIGLGMHIGQINHQDALLESRNAIQAFEQAMNQQPFTLTIEWAEGVLIEDSIAGH